MGLLDALQYAGDSLAKPGRAVRGLLSGRPDELLAALPFSDSLGVTDPTRAVTGQALLGQYGLDPGGTAGDVAGFAADALTDPLTYFGGKLAASAVRGLRGGAASRGGSLSEAIGRLAPETFDLDSPLAASLGRDATFATPRPPITFEPAPLADLPRIPPERGLLTPPPESAESLIARLEAERSTRLNRQAADLAAAKPLEQMPSPGDYMLLDPHVTPDFFGFPGPPVPSTTIPGVDLIQEGRPLDAMRASLGIWQKALGDMGRLSAGGRIKMAEDRAWMELLANRQNELNALAPAADFLNPEAKSLLRAAQEQSSEVVNQRGPYRASTSPTEPFEALLRKATTALDHGPQEGGRVAAGLGALPFEEKALRAAMAKNQLEMMGERTRSGLEYIFDEPIGNLLGAPPATIDPFAAFDPSHVAERAAQLINPSFVGHMKAPNNLVEQFFAGLDDNTAALLRRLLEQAGPYAHPSRPLTPTPALAERLARLGR